MADVPRDVALSHLSVVARTGRMIAFWILVVTWFVTLAFIAIQLAGCTTTMDAHVTGQTTKENPSVTSEETTENSGLFTAEKPN